MTAINLSSPPIKLLSESEEMYLATIAQIQKERSPGPVPLSQLANLMDVLPVSANQMVRKLEEAGLVIYTPYKGVELTEMGSGEANRILCHRRLWVTFLVDHLQYTPEEANPLACRLEHILPPEAAERLAAYLGDAGAGAFSPDVPNCKSNFSPISYSIPLSQARINERGTIVGGIENSQVGSFLDLQGLSLGAGVLVLATSGSELLVESETGRVVLLSAELAESIRIQFD